MFCVFSLTLTLISLVHSSPCDNTTPNCVQVGGHSYLNVTHPWTTRLSSTATLLSVLLPRSSHLDYPPGERFGYRNIRHVYLYYKCRVYFEYLAGSEVYKLITEDVSPEHPHKFQLFNKPRDYEYRVQWWQGWLQVGCEELRKQGFNQM